MAPVETAEPIETFPAPANRQRPAEAGAARPRAFDASEGTQRDPLLNKSFDLNSPKTVPTLRN
jgi:UPF0755 protein